MYTKKKYSAKQMLLWTRRELRFFFLWALAITTLFEVVGLHWLQVPWAALALIGTAVAFLIGFQSNAVYGRLWEARQIWGGIVNDSRMFGIMVKDMITNEHAKEPATEAELKALKQTIVFRHIAWLTSLRHAMRQIKPWESFRSNKKINTLWMYYIFQNWSLRSKTTLNFTFLMKSIAKYLVKQIELLPYCRSNQTISDS
jgi:putative membrane protein